VFLGESSVDCAMTRLYGRAPAGEGVCGYVPDARFERTSVISTVRLDGGQAPMVFKGALDGKTFAACAEEVLAPTLREGGIVVMDNLSVHKVKGALGPVYAAGAEVLFLPPHSPEWNPIGLAWSKMKATLNRLKERTFDGLVKAMGAALEAITPPDISGWFRHCGYC